MEFIIAHGTLILFLACAFGFFMAWGIGANDVANAMGTSVGSGVLTVRQAIVVAMIFEFCGAYLAGGAVTETVRSGIVDSGVMENTPHLLVYGMMASLLASALWLMIASTMGWPVSTTHTVIGAIVGFAAVGIGVDAVQWSQIGNIVLSWVVSPLLAGTISYLLFRSVQKLILDTADPFTRAKRYVPFYIFLTGFMVSMVTFTKGLKHVGLGLNMPTSIALAVFTGLLVAGIGAALLTRIQPSPEKDHRFRFASTERLFAILMIFTACAMAFAHGSNDVSNAVGPLAAIYSVVASGGEVSATSAIPSWILLLGAIGIVAGLAIFGRRVMRTVGEKITELTPSRGFAAELGAASTVVLASGTGLPVSTTHTLVGAILGVGLARSISALNLRVISGIFTSWIVTLPAGALFSIMFFFMFLGMFGH
ncbi:inorganic phosphate transporter [Alcanivorax quisquiliarum]|uniref:Phosphate transporter n=1 Tax=Alcanivorax quisquiliarum TaxID=2933565 RepID=A0ABT0EAW4_9GAMM|nr:inorganic phosphate transporter [Alcanivorax quisquiliarum]MCK0538754.1 inorganic phosphate transporter [Alcanivorax quisquiliarum]